MIKWLAPQPDIHDTQTQNALYELVADFGEFYGYALRLDSHLTLGTDRSENWLKMKHDLSVERAHQLYDGDTPTPDELQKLIDWQIKRAFELNESDHIATLWLCRNSDINEIVAIEGWSNTLDTELKFKWIGRYPDEGSTIQHLNELYIVSMDDPAS